MSPHWISATLQTQRKPPLCEAILGNTIYYNEFMIMQVLYWRPWWQQPPGETLLSHRNVEQAHGDTGGPAPHEQHVWRWVFFPFHQSNLSFSFMLVLWIRIPIDPELLSGSGSGIIVADPHPAKSKTAYKWNWILGCFYYWNLVLNREIEKRRNSSSLP